MQQLNDMDTVCYEKAFDMVSKGHQVRLYPLSVPISQETPTS